MVSLCEVVDFMRWDLPGSSACRSRGSLIFANNERNTTVNLHAFDGTTFCEVRGTAVFAPNGSGLKVPPRSIRLPE